MPANWITHTPSLTPLIITDDDLAEVTPSRVNEFFVIVQTEVLYGTTKSGGELPQGLHEALLGCKAEDVVFVLAQAIVGGSMMDSGWLEDYWCICERVAGALRGYPKQCVRQWRGLKDAVAGRLKEGSGLDQQARATSSKVKEAENQIKDKKTIFRFLELPEHIRHHIYQLLIPHDVLTVSDWAFASSPKAFSKRTEYEVPDENNELRRTTYVVHSSTPPHPHLNIMLASRILYHETVQILYASTFSFRGTASGTLAFLHDRMKSLSRLKRISFRYTTTSKTGFRGCFDVAGGGTPPSTIKTSFVIWRKILRMLRLSATALEDFELVVDQHFWDKERVEWMKGAQTVLGDRALCEQRLTGKNGQPEIKNFLREVSQLTGVDFRLVIEGIKQDEEEEVKKGFRRELEKLVCKKMHGREYVATKGSKCSCKKRLLSEACAWREEGQEEEEGGKRRLSVV
ncbi:uncharacterized protein BDR25DRAFT_306522 [Lindgomyces ingoldianus]|uniref:Uncharacterized protein n=1 Tax=Lindgomyces ingoldianus TaxID=673940 RepID=A0ACB6QGW2_9PLEO|nr:uncharacterized protein BDR25DRAFT_306522 [Lindgomyces ingoldianus]KAF2465745.1 hypothetical protein BDR25DRAFT_306522 [Lindgomyces ingoldianus]